jgi:hypothetical protein
MFEPFLKAFPVNLGNRKYLLVFLAGIFLALFTVRCTAQDQILANPGTGSPTPAVIQTEAPPITSPKEDPDTTPSPANPAKGSSPDAQPDASAINSVPLPQYTITATLSYAGHLLQVDERIDYTNSSKDALTELVLMVDAIYFPGVFTLHSLTWISPDTPAAYTWENAILHVQLPSPLPPGEQVAMRLSYTLNLPSPTPSAQVRPIPFGYTSRQTNLVDWYPFIAPYRSGAGWLAHTAGFFGEHLVHDVAYFDVSIKIEDARTDLIVAASAQAQEENGWFHYRLEYARDFSWSVSHEYIVASTQGGQPTITSYTFPHHAKAGGAVLKTTAEALALFSDLFGKYPRSALSVVEADFLDGMEYDGLYFLSNGFYNLYQSTPGEYLVAIAAHETAHMWWYALVGNDQALEPWLDEALCTYSELLFYEHYYPEAIDWWWAYRINYYEPHGWVNGSIYNPDGYRAYRDAIYLNGAVFLDKLRNEIGPENFAQFLRAYAAQYAHQIASSADFFALLNEYSEEDLSVLIASYFLTTP